MLAAWLATKLFVEENFKNKTINTGTEEGKDMSPWLLNKRINQECCITFIIFTKENIYMIIFQIGSNTRNTIIPVSFLSLFIYPDK